TVAWNSRAQKQKAGKSVPVETGVFWSAFRRCQLARLALAYSTGSIKVASSCMLCPSVRQSSCVPSQCARTIDKYGAQNESASDRPSVRICLPAYDRCACCFQVQALSALRRRACDGEDLRVPRQHLTALALLPCGRVLPHV